MEINVEKIMSRSDDGNEASPAGQTFTQQEIQRLNKVAKDANLTPPETSPAPTEKPLGTFGKVLDFLNTTNYMVSGVLGKLGIGGEGKKLISERLLGEPREKTAIGSALRFITGTALDIFLDPLTYLTFGGWGLLKVASKTGKIIRATTAGEKVLDALAEGMLRNAVTKSPHLLEQANKLKQLQSRYTREAQNILVKLTEPNLTLKARGGQKMVETALKTIGVEPTKEALQNVVENGIKGLHLDDVLSLYSKRTGIRIPIITRNMIDKTKDIVDNTSRWLIEKSPTAKSIFDGLEKTKNLMLEKAEKFFPIYRNVPQEVKFLNTLRLNKIENSLNNIREKLSVILEPIEKNPESQKRIVLALDTGKIDKLTNVVERKVYFDVKNLLNEVAIVEEKKGLLEKTLKDYITHLYENPQGADAIAKAINNGRASVLSRYAHSRRIPLLSIAEELGLNPVYDLKRILGARLMAHANAIHNADFVNAVANRYGKIAKIIRITKDIKEKAGKIVVKEKALKAIDLLRDDYVRLSKVVVKLPKNMPQKLAVPRHIAEYIGEALKKQTIDNEGLRILLKGYDRALNFVKRSVTVAFPAFHIRNARSNILNSFLEIGLGALDPVSHKQTIDILTGKTGVLIDRFGRKYSYDYLRKIIKRTGIMREDLQRLDFTSAGGLEFLEAAKKYSPLRAGSKIGQFIENEARLQLFLYKIKSGNDIPDAVSAVNRVLFDYSNLSAFERVALKRLIPFYTWTTRNIVLQISQMLKNPARQSEIAKTIVNLNNSFYTPIKQEEQKYLPAYLQEGIAYLTEKHGDDASILYGFDIPLEDVFQKIRHPIREFLIAMSPFIKVPIELSTGFNFFTDKRIKEDDWGGEFKSYPQKLKEWLDFRTIEDKDPKTGKTLTTYRVDPYKKYLFKSASSLIGAARFASSLDEIVASLEGMRQFLSGEPLSMENKIAIIRFWGGIGLRQYNFETGRYLEEKKRLNEIIDYLDRQGLIEKKEIHYKPKERKVLELE